MDTLAQDDLPTTVKQEPKYGNHSHSHSHSHSNNGGASNSSNAYHNNSNTNSNIASIDLHLGGPKETVRVNLFEVRKRLFALLGAQAHRYWTVLKLAIAAKRSKYELDLELRTLLADPTALALHNQLIQGVVHNACSGTHPPRPSEPFLVGRKYLGHNSATAYTNRDQLANAKLKKPRDPLASVKYDSGVNPLAATGGGTYALIR